MCLAKADVVAEVYGQKVHLTLPRICCKFCGCFFWAKKKTFFCQENSLLKKKQQHQNTKEHPSGFICPCGSANVSQGCRCAPQKTGTESMRKAFLPCGSANAGPKSASLLKQTDKMCMHTAFRPCACACAHSRYFLSQKQTRGTNDTCMAFLPYACACANSKHIFLPTRRNTRSTCTAFRPCACACVPSRQILLPTQKRGTMCTCTAFRPCGFAYDATMWSLVHKCKDTKSMRRASRLYASVHAESSRMLSPPHKGTKSTRAASRSSGFACASSH